MRSSFLEYGEYPYVTASEIKKALKIKQAFSTMLDSVAITPSSIAAMTITLEIDDIQHFLLARTPARAARYEFRLLDTHGIAGPNEPLQRGECHYHLCIRAGISPVSRSGRPRTSSGRSRLKWFPELANRSTYEGHSIQAVAGITF